ncbi:MAG: hypothetical protein JW750_10850 [Anaerolineaceae bacterium]|nr:hypothetical protein [Anaerolineaceae bacterium]
MIVLIDMDNTIADFEGLFQARWEEKHPDLPIKPFHERTDFYLRKESPADYRDKITDIMVGEDFFCSMQPIPGALEAIAEMEMLGWQVFLCTSSFFNYSECAACKFAWVKEHLGSGWRRRTIITGDKTLVRGDYLIDDKPYIQGAVMPVWEHILYDQPYNRMVNGQRRLTWANWKQVLGVETPME